MKIRNKIIVGFLTLTSVLSISVALLFSEMSKLNHLEERLNYSYNQLIRVKTIYSDLNRQMKELADVIFLDKNRHEFIACEQRILAGISEWEKSIEREIQFVKDEEEKEEEMEEIKYVEAINQNYLSISKELHDIIKLNEEGYHEVALNRMKNILEDEFDNNTELFQLFNQIIKGEEQEAKTALAEFVEFALFIKKLSIAILGFIFLSVLIISISMIRSIAKPIDKLKKVAIELGNGNFDAKTDFISNDEIGLLGNIMNRLGNNLKNGVVGLEYVRKRSIELKNVIIDFAKGEYTVQAKISNKKDEFDSIAAGLNKMIVELSEKEENLRKAKEKVEENDQLKSAFLRNLSHEIRTPLNVILGFSELILEEVKDNKTLNDFVNDMRNSSDHLLNIVSNVIEISKIETQQIKLQEETVCLTEMLNSVYSSFKLEAEKKNLEFKVEITLLNNKSKIITDSTRLIQILNNLIGNAIKFTNQGMIIYGCELIDEHIQFYVKDSGVGIATEYHELIFERFRQIDNRISRQYEGLGLGLSISKALVDNLGGRIWLESTEGVGSVFFFTIPFKPA